MKRLVYPIAFILAFAVPTMAQQLTTPNEYNLKLAPSDVDTLGKALGKLPFDEVSGLIQKLRTQIVDQQTPKKEDTKPIEEKK